MKCILLVCCIGVVLSAPSPQAQSQPIYKEPVPIVHQESDANIDGTFKFSFEGGDGTRVNQEGQLKAVGNEAGEISQGSFSYVGDDGKNYGVTYTADENGFQPIGDHLPQPPPIPEAIAKALAHLATKPPSKDELEQ